MNKILFFLIAAALSYFVFLGINSKNVETQNQNMDVFQPSPVASHTAQQAEPSKQISNNNKIGTNYYVDPSAGNDSNSGLSLQSPFKSIQKAIDVANPGDIVNLSSGTYSQDVVSVRDGTKNAPITIKGEQAAIVKGAGSSRIFEINHNYIHLEGFTLDGLSGNPKEKRSFRDKLIYVLGKRPLSGVTGFKATRMVLKNAGGECLRLRYYATNNEISYNTIGPCGAFDFKFESNNKNGEGIYIGTAVGQWKDGKNPTKDPDRSTKNFIHHNNFNTQGNECVDIKEGSFENIIEQNSCTGQMDSESGGFDARGDRNIIRNNLIFENKGAGVRLGGHNVGRTVYGIGNDVYNNTFRANLAGGIKIETEPQGKICGNDMSQNDSPAKFGSKAEKYDPEKSCSLRF